MKDFETYKEWQRKAFCVHKKHEYESRQKPGFHIYTKHGPEYLPLIFDVIRKSGAELFVELGTFMGGVTLAIHEEFPELPIYSFDKNVRLSDESRKLFGKNVVFMQLDILRNVAIKIKNVLMQSPKKILYCDNGDKTTEMNMYGKFLKKGEIIGCHDWLCEVNPADVEEMLKDYELFDPETWIGNTCLCRFWRKINEIHQYPIAH